MNEEYWDSQREGTIMDKRKIVHLRLKPSLAAKLERDAQLSRRTETDVLRLYLADGRIEQLGIQETGTESSTVKLG